VFSGFAFFLVCHDPNGCTTVAIVGQAANRKRKLAGRLLVPSAYAD
jgi:hypothetical protein